MIVSSRVKHLERHDYNANEIDTFEDKVSEEKYEKFMSSNFEKTNEQLTSYSSHSKIYQKYYF